MRKNKFLILLCASTSASALLAGCDGNKVEISGLESKYHAEYGEIFYIPEPEIINSEEDYTVEVVDSGGNQVLEALFGSFYPEIGDYSINYSVEDTTKSVVLECRDTVGPKVDYVDYISVAFEGDNITIPKFTATDKSGVADNATFAIYKDDNRTQAISPTGENDYIVAEVGVKEYHFIYSVSDLVGNKTTLDLVTTIRELFSDSQIDDDTMFDFDEPNYVNLIASSNVDSTSLPEVSHVTSGLSGMNGGAIKLDYNQGNKYYGATVSRGNLLNTEVYHLFTFKVYTTATITNLTIEPMKTTLAPVSFSDIVPNEWTILKFSAGQMSPDFIDIDFFDFRFSAEAAGSLYIDEIKGIPLSVDDNIKANYIADFDEELYLNNIEQAGYDIGNGQITAEHSIVSKDNMPELAKEGTNGGALRVKVNDVWAADYAGFGVLGDGVKYNLKESFNTSELTEGGALTIRFFCETGNGLALSFNYKNPVTGTINRSKARWVRGVEGEWVDLKLDYSLITQIVPYKPITKADGGVYEDFDITAIVITTCGNVPVDEAHIDQGVRDACTLFYIDSIKLVKSYFDDNNLESGIIADFNEEAYADSIAQAWTYVAVTADIDFRPEGSTNLPEGTKGGAIYCKSNYVSEEVFPNQGARGDGVRYYLPQPILADNLNEVSLRVYAEKGTACYVGYVVMDSEGNRVQRQGYWENCSNGEGAWSTITQDKSRLSIRLEPTDEIIAILLYSRGDGLGNLTSLTEFYLDEIGAKFANSLTWKNTKVSSSTEGWGESLKGGEQVQVLTYENRNNNFLSKYPYFEPGTFKEDNFMNGLNEGDEILEVVSRHEPNKNYCDGAKVTFNSPLAFGDNTKLEIKMFATSTTHGGYSFYIKDSDDNMHTWRVQNTDYSGYNWSTLSINLNELRNSNLKDIKSIDLVAVGASLDPGMTCTYAAYKMMELKK